MSEATVPSAPASAPATARLLSDDRLALRATKGDRRAFAAIYRRYHQDLYRYCAAILGNPQDAQDALQNTMVKVLAALPGEERRIQLKPWLYRIAHNEAIELLRSRRVAEPIGPELVAPGSGPPEAVELRERLRRLIDDLGDLPPRQRGALVMRELAGLSFEQIGAALQTSPAVARQAVYEARINLRRIGEGREVGCGEVMRALSDGDGRVVRRRDLRAHLRSCSDCREFRDVISERRRDLAALAPLSASASTGLLHGILGTGFGGSGGGVIGGAGAGAGKALATSAVLKSAAMVAVVAAVGISAADRGGLIHVGLPGDGGSSPARTRPPGGGGEAAQPAPSTAPHRAGAGIGSAQVRAVAKSDVGTSHPVAAARGDSTLPGRAADAGAGGTASAPYPHGSSASRHGSGHESELPAAAAHGQRTAAEHKGAGHSSPHAHSHPAHPSNSNAANAHAAPPQSHGSGHEMPPQAASTPHSTNPQGTPPAHETGKQP